MFNIKDKYYQRIKKKIETGEFVPGKDYSFNRWFDINSFDYLPMEDRTPEICHHLLSYGVGHLWDVPKESRTREFFLNSYYHRDVNQYIKKHIADFDRDFFKDLIATSKDGALSVRGNNCFDCMPVEYIDEEMCSLAIMQGTNWIEEEWFRSVVRRKPSALTSDLWHLATRLYIKNGEHAKEWMKMIPEEFKDTEMYLQVGKCNYNCGIEIHARKEHILECVPPEVITEEFVTCLLQDNPSNITALTDEQLEMEVEGEKLWQLLLNVSGNLMDYMELNDERIAFFLQLYGKDTPEYKEHFKMRYKQYIKEREDKEAVEIQRFIEETETIFNAIGTLILSSFGETPDQALDIMKNITREENIDRLPIYYNKPVPNELKKEYDSEEYLALLYTQLGIKILGEKDFYYYSVQLPDGWMVVRIDDNYAVVNQEGETVILYSDNNKFYDRDVEIIEINMPKEKPKEKEKKDDKE